MFKGRSNRRKAETRSLVNLFHAVEVLPGLDACEEVKELDGRRLLSEEAPMLPLPSCTRFGRCSCRYRHFKDRRTDVRRESDEGLPARFAEPERRNQIGRRITDH